MIIRWSIIIVNLLLLFYYYGLYLNSICTRDDHQAISFLSFAKENISFGAPFSVIVQLLVYLLPIP